MASLVAVQSSQQQQQAHGYGQPSGYGYTYPTQQYYPGPATNMASQQSHNTNVVVTNQPAPAPERVRLPTEKPSPAVFIVTVVLMSVFTCLGLIPFLVCFIPALILSVVGFNYGYSKSDELQKQSRAFTHAAAALDIIAMVVFALTLVIAAIVASVTSANATTTAFFG